MDSIFKSDVFFFITSLAVIIATACFIVIAVYLMKIVRNVKSISDQAREETERIVEDIEQLREETKDKTRIIALLQSIPALFGKFTRKKRK